MLLKHSIEVSSNKTVIVPQKNHRIPPYKQKELKHKSNTKYQKLQIDGGENKPTFTSKWINRKKWEEPNLNLIESHIPGTILNINVKEGQEVEADDVLLTLQAMKMNNKITAPFSAKIKKIYVKAGDQIAKDTLMIELEE